MRRVLALLLLMGLVTMGSARAADARVSVGISAPVVSIGIDIPLFPELVIVPGYPVYYAPRLNANYFFYDGFYWVFNVQDGQWYSSLWYNGPWVYVEPIVVPQPILVIPLRYYRVYPVYWAGWVIETPPRWGQHWGRDWESRRAGWNRWEPSRAPAAAPLPTYQRDYPRDRYPTPTQQVTIHNERYKYQPRDLHVQQERATIVRQESAGGARATERAQRVAKAPPARREGQESVQRPAAPRSEPQPGAQREQAPRRERPQESVQPPPAPRRDSPREQVAPQQAPRRERPPESVQPPPAPRRERQPVAPREQAGPQQAPRGERPGQPPAKEERQHERQQEKGPEGRSEEGRK